MQQQHSVKNQIKSKIEIEKKFISVARIELKNVMNRLFELGRIEVLKIDVQTHFTLFSTFSCTLNCLKFFFLSAFCFVATKARFCVICTKITTC